MRRRAQARQAHRARARGRPVPRHPPDDRRAASAGATRGARVAGQGRARRASTSRTARCCSPRPARRSARRSTSCAARRRSPRTIRAGSRCSRPTSRSFRARLRAENHTLKRALTDPRILSGIGNAYSDEILHRARLSPVKLTQRLDDEEIARLFDATPRDARATGPSACASEAGEGFPEKVTAFRPGDGGARPLRQALPGLRRARAAHRLRRERDQLLRRAARPAASCSPTARSRGCSRRTGRARSRSSRRARRGVSGGDPAALAARIRRATLRAP